MASGFAKLGVLRSQLGTAVWADRPALFASANAANATRKQNDFNMSSGEKTWQDRDLGYRKKLWTDQPVRRSLTEFLLESINSSATAGPEVPKRRSRWENDSSALSSSWLLKSGHNVSQKNNSV